ncbi:MAG: thymidine kinase [Rhodoferax sp.]
MAKLFFRYSAMNAGKSTALLQIAYNYEEQGQRVHLFTAAIDNRRGAGCIASRLGLQRQADVFDGHTEFFALLSNEVGLACVLVDEAQFLSPLQVRQLHRLANTSNVPVICFGLRSDFMGNAFLGSAQLLTLADDIEEIKTICACGRKATMNIRNDAQGKRVHAGEQVEIGGNERYQQVCARCFYGEID